MSLFGELRRRNVIRVAAAYIVLSWLVLQIADVLLSTLDLPTTYSKFIFVLLAIGFIPALVFSWVYELTPEGLKRESDLDPNEPIRRRTAAKLNAAIVILLACAVGIYGLDRLVLNRAVPGPAQPAADTGTSMESAEPGQVSGESSGAEITAPPEEASVAVLPFTTRSMEESDRFFTDGVHDDLLTQLAKIGELKVISRTSVMEYRDTTKRVPEIAEELGVATIVEGAVQRAGDTVRITAQLIDAKTDEHLWAESYDRELTPKNLFAIQTEIATSIAQALHAKLSPEEQAALQRTLTDDQQALDAYKRARWLLTSFALESTQQAEQELGVALDRDPGFAAAWALLARVYMSYYWFGNPVDEYRQKADAAIERARALDPDLPEVAVAQGYYYYWGFRDYDRALEVLQPVLAIYPNDAELLKLIGFINRRAGNFEKSLEFLHRALERDPRNPEIFQTLAETSIRLGRYDAGERYVASMEEVAPADSIRFTMRAMLAMFRDHDPAKAARLQESVSGSYPFSRPAAFRAYLMAGDYSSALRVADEASRINATFGFTPAYGRGLVFYLTEDDAAQAELRKAVDELEALGAQLSDPAYAYPSLCQVHGALGDVGKARRLCARAVEDLPYDAFNLPMTQNWVATGYAMAGMNDEAFAALGRAVASPVGPHRIFLEHDPLLASLHDDPRWGELMSEAHP